MKKLVLQVISGAILIVFTLTAINPAHGMVLCFGEDGHLSLEYGDEGTCMPDASSISSDDCDQCCYNCVDIPMISLDGPIIQQSHETLSPALSLNPTPSISLSSVLSHNITANFRYAVESMPETSFVLRI